jgi:naphthoate synthase
MHAFLAGRAPDFNRFRRRDQKALAEYLDGCARDLNAPPAMRVKRR